MNSVYPPEFAGLAFRLSRKLTMIDDLVIRGNEQLAFAKRMLKEFQRTGRPTKEIDQARKLVEKITRDLAKATRTRDILVGAFESLPKVDPAAYMPDDE